MPLTFEYFMDPVNLRFLRLFLAMGAAWLAAPVFAQTTITFQDGVAPTSSYVGTRDVTVTDFNYVDPVRDPNTNYNTNLLTVDAFPGRKTILLRFDLSSLAPGTTVNSVNLQLRVTDDSPQTAEVHAVLKSWSETGATWNQAAPGVGWGLSGASESGVDFSPPAAGSFNAPAIGVVNVPLTPSVVQGWVNTPASNQGVIILPAGMDNGIDLASCEHATLGFRPGLVVTHSGGTVVTFREGVSPSAAYSGCADTTIAKGPPANTNLNGGPLRPFQASNSGQVLLAFDVSTLPPATTVISGSLSLTVEEPMTAPATVRAVTGSWSESASTATTRDGTTPWDQPVAAGPNDSSVEVMATLDGSSRGRATAALTAAGVQRVQEWVSGATLNNGFMIQRPAVSGGMLLWSREYEVAAFRPALTLTVILPPEAVDGGSAPVPAVGPDPFLNYQVGCGCNASSDAGFFLVGLSVLAMRLMRRSRS
jgi:hypothetical protein